MIAVITGLIQFLLRRLQVQLDLLQHLPKIISDIFLIFRRISFCQQLLILQISFTV